MSRLAKWEQQPAPARCVFVCSPLSTKVRSRVRPFDKFTSQHERCLLSFSRPFDQQVGVCCCYCSPKRNCRCYCSPLSPKHKTYSPSATYAANLPTVHVTFHKAMARDSYIEGCPVATKGESPPWKLLPLCDFFNWPFWSQKGSISHSVGTDWVPYSIVRFNHCPNWPKSPFQRYDRQIHTYTKKYITQSRQMTTRIETCYHLIQNWWKRKKTKPSE